MAAVYASNANQVAALKELYKDTSDFMKDVVYKENPLMALIPKDESADAMGGKYLPVPLEYGNPQGRSHTFSNAQNQQTATSMVSFFVYVIQDYQLVTITNQLLKSTQTNAQAFVQAAKLQLEGGFRNITNNMAFELFGDGSGARAEIASGTAPGGNVYTIVLANSQSVVNLEVGMTLVNFTLSSNTVSAISSTTAQITSVNRGTGEIRVLASGADVTWNTAGKKLGVAGDIVAGAVNTGSSLCLTGIAGWIPSAEPSISDSFWGVNRSTDATRLAGIRYDGSPYTIEEALTNALGLVNREGGKPDLCVMDFASYTALVNSLGAKVQYTQARHDEVEVAFDGIKFQSAYGIVTVLADRSCPAQTAYLLTLSTWKLRTMGKAPGILTYGMEGLEGLRVSDADALEIRIGYYGNLVCSAPAWNAVVSLSS